MTSTPPEAPIGPPPDPTGNQGPRVDRDQVRDLGRLRRSVTDRKVAGVAGGLGRHLDIDPLILRVAFVVLVFFGGAGLIVYGACWLLVPEDGSPKAAINLDDKSRSIVLIVIGAIAALAMIGDSWGGNWFPWPLAVIALVALWLLTRNSPPSRPVPPAPPAPPAAPYDPAAYAAPAAETTYVAPPTYQQPVYYTEPIKPFDSYVRPPNPRKRGPILFWFTLALIALSEGLLGIIDLAGADVATSAYPALAVGICGVMLLVGSFFGRAGGIIVVGLVSAVVLAITTAVGHWDVDRTTPTPASAAMVEDTYSMNNGEIILDLRDVSDVNALDGRTIELDGEAGHIEVILPRFLGATVHADIDGPGNIRLFGDETGDWGFTKSATNGLDQPHITIDAQLNVGEIEVHR